MAERRSFIHDIVDADLASGRHREVVTRFPPEPNGYLHIGHAKSICLNFGLAQTYGGRCHLRFDDTNPTTEDVEFVESIQRDVRWLGFDWGEHLYFASDYFERLYQHAVHLIETGRAYVCSLTEDEVRAHRGTVTEPGTPSPYRERGVQENLDLLRRMRAGEFREGEHVLRAKIDMASANMKMRDPLLYRIKHAHHYRTGDAWCIYPLYDFTHCLSDAIEGITHSICTLEFENNRELYDWVLDHTTHPAVGGEPARPHQYEFARLDLGYTMMSKRKLAQLVAESHVSGWDDPRMPTIAGMRRRGVTPEAIRAFCDMIGVAKNNSLVDISKLEFCIRDDLNRRAPRVMCVLAPLCVTITDYPAGASEQIEAPSFPSDVGKEGSRPLPLGRTVYIEQGDFMRDPPKGFHRLSPGAAVRLRFGPVIVCDEVIEQDGEVVELRCHRSEDDKPRGTIHWVSAEHALDVEVRLYDRLFQSETPADLDDLNQRSLEVLRGCKIEPSVAGAVEGRFQFERHGYFCVDSVDSRPGALVFNRTVTLRDSWAKLAAAPSLPEPRKSRPERPSAPKEAPRAPVLDAAARTRAEELTAAGVAPAAARVLAERPELSRLCDDAVAAGADPLAAGNWIANEVLGVLKSEAKLRFGGKELAALLALAGNAITITVAKELLAELAAKGGDPAAMVEARGAARLSAADLDRAVTGVLADHPGEVERYRAGEKKLAGFLVGQLMRATKGQADPKVARAALVSSLDQRSP